jgi:hypothetical protein
MAEYGITYRTPEPRGKMVKLTMDNNVDFSGNYTVTFTATGTTAVTLPTTGTITTNAGAATLTNKTLTAPILTPSTPASASATGVAGTIAADTGFIYVCTATNTWKRVAIATW